MSGTTRARDRVPDRVEGKDIILGLPQCIGRAGTQKHRVSLRGSKAQAVGLCLVVPKSTACPRGLGLGGTCHRQCGTLERVPGIQQHDSHR